MSQASDRVPNATGRGPRMRIHPKRPGFVMGVGLGGSVDGIVLHQILQWHHLLADTGRIVLEQAKGIISERLDLDMERSFAILRNHARSYNLRLSDDAQSVIDGSLSPSELKRCRLPRADPLLAPRWARSQAAVVVIVRRVTDSWARSSAGT